MANKGADRFCKNLFAAFSRWKIPQETKDLYEQKLGNWRLKDDQWARCLSRIIADRDELPTLNVIYEYLRSAQQVKTSEEDLGWMTFKDSDGRTMAVKVRAEAGHWVNAPCSVSSRHGESVILQNHPGCQPALPEGHGDVSVLPDKPYETEERASQTEAESAFKEGWVASGADPVEADAIFEAAKAGTKTRIPRTGWVQVRDVLLPKIGPRAESQTEEPPIPEEVPF